ncbi:hypothetical protein BDV24DRAFT_132235 [Aspergillus arachidicola]|uniref:Uncharacterized protein n=1 Tax=Aspergillus arachidicola TaxID=656916 RepID=A0A5N6YA03_9EURO|nr:hypothetical protein BDV24DRAFT_132235 [Aspergillus arachidicola]
MSTNLDRHPILGPKCRITRCQCGHHLGKVESAEEPEEFASDVLGRMSHGGCQCRKYAGQVPAGAWGKKEANNRGDYRYNC